METLQFIDVLEAVLSPVILLSGMGLIFLTSTNRLGRATDRARILAMELKSGNMKEGDRSGKLKQISILHKRSRILQVSILSTTFSIIATSLLILCLFLALSFNAPTSGFGSLLLLLIIGGIAVAAISLFIEASFTLHALELEIENL